MRALLERDTRAAASHTLIPPHPHGRRAPRGAGGSALQRRRSAASRPDPAAPAPQLLGLRGRESYLDPQILAAYEGLLAAPLEPGFSEGAGEGRAFLLQAAADELRRTRGRAPPGEARGIYVEWALLPGALALLQEARRPAAPPEPLAGPRELQRIPGPLCLFRATLAARRAPSARPGRPRGRRTWPARAGGRARGRAWAG